MGLSSSCCSLLPIHGLTGADSVNNCAVDVTAVNVTVHRRLSILLLLLLQQRRLSIIGRLCDVSKLDTYIKPWPGLGDVDHADHTAHVSGSLGITRIILSQGMKRAVSQAQITDRDSPLLMRLNTVCRAAAICATELP